MAGINEQTAAVDAQTALNLALRNYVMASQKIQQDQQALIYELQARFFKKPSVFKAGLFSDSIFQYSLPAYGTAGAFWCALTTDVPPLTVTVFDLQDADLVRIVFRSGDGTATSPPYIAYALSPSDFNSQIPPDQFSLLRTCTSALLSNGGDSSMNFVDDEIPCSGNRYIHLFGAVDSNDLVSILDSSNTNNVLTYALIK